MKTPTNRILKEKVDGLNNREKFRIRMYNDDTSFIRLEKKTKINGFCNKIDAPVTQAQCERAIDGDTSQMKKSEYAFLTELYAKTKFEQLRPKTIADCMCEPSFTAPEMSG